MLKILIFGGQIRLVWEKINVSHQGVNRPKALIPCFRSVLILLEIKFFIEFKRELWVKALLNAT